MLGMLTYLHLLRIANILPAPSLIIEPAKNPYMILISSQAISDYEIGLNKLILSIRDFFILTFDYL
jgi:hypothetical protein